MRNLEIKLRIDTSNKKELDATIALLSFLSNSAGNPPLGQEMETPNKVKKMEVVSEEIKKDPPKESPAAKKKKSGSEEETKKQKEVAKELPKEEEHTPTDLDAIRETLSEKVGENKPTIREELSRLGVKNISKLTPAQLPAFHEFLKSL